MFFRIFWKLTPVRRSPKHGVFSWLMNSLAPCLAVGVKAFAHGWAQLHQISALCSRDPIIGSSFLDQKLQISCNAQRTT